MMTDIAFFLLAIIAVVAGWRVFVVDSMVRSAFLLMVSFIAVGLIGVLLSAPYIGIATLFMMAVEMLIMAIFMVMFMMNPAGLNPMQMVHQHKLSIAAGVIAFVVLGAAALLTTFPDNPVPQTLDVVESLGKQLLGDSMLVFETAGVTLLATMVGSVILSSRPGRYGDADQGSVPPGLEPGGKPAGRIPEKSGGHGGHGGHGGMDHGDMDHGDMDHSKMDHSKMGHGETDHSKMDHSKMSHGDMSGSAAETGATPTAGKEADPHAKHGRKDNK